MLENQLIQLKYDRITPATGDASHDYSATYYLDFTRLANISANKTYKVTRVSGTSTATAADEWAMDSCLIAVVRGQTPWADTLSPTIVKAVANWNEEFTSSVDATIYIAWGIKEYLQYLVGGGTPAEATDDIAMTATGIAISGELDELVAEDANPLLLPIDCAAGEPLQIFVSNALSAITLVDENDTTIATESVTSTPRHFALFATGGLFASIEDSIAIGDRFFIKLTRTSGTPKYSQPIVRVDKQGFSYLKYRCNEDALGFPFHTAGDKYASAYVFLRISSPQYSQKDETYEKLNGEVVTLFAKYYREYEGETEYLPVEVHDAIIAALSCDEVYIDGKRVAKSDNYSIDWEKYDTACNGDKLARATFKVRENMNQRNSNY